MDVRFQAGSFRFNYRSAGILMEQNHVLFHRQKEDTYWSLPGGGIEMGETSKDSVIREWKEELGHDVTVHTTAWIDENFFPYKEFQMHEVAYYFVLRSGESYYRKEPFNGMEGERLVYQWLPLDRLGDYDIRPDFLIEGLKNVPCETKHLIKGNLC